MYRKMMLGGFVVAVVLVAGATQALAQVAPSKYFSETYQKAAMASVVRLRASDGRQAWQGCGVCISYNANSGIAYILTARHVVKNANRMTFEVFTMNSYPDPVRVYKTAQWRSWWSQEDDIALVKARIWVPMVMKLAESDNRLEKGHHVLSIGCGLGAAPGCQIGRFDGVHESGDYSVDCGLIGGRSGGPLISQQGLIGILSRGRNDVTLFVSHDKIVRFFRQVVAQSRN